MTEPELAVRVDNVHVGYSVYEDGSGGMKNMFSGERRRARRIKAVRGLSFDLHRGESLGIIGSNGSGKSTLLAAMTGLLPVESGNIWVRARPTLLGVGAVMRPSLSGRRNIIVGGLALGLPLAEIKARMQDVIAFAGLEESIDLPMRTYSSGMRARLMFSIATATTPEILLIDEALAVGDSEFSQRSQRRIDEIRATAGAVVVVSHNLSELQRSCDRVMWMDRGELIQEGSPDVVIAAYEAKINGLVADERPATSPGGGDRTREVASSRTTSGVGRERTVTLHIGSNFTVDPIQRYLRAEEESIRHHGFSVPAFLRRRSHVEFVGLAAESAAERLPISFGGADWATWTEEFGAIARRQLGDGRDWVVSSEAFATQLGPKSIAAVTEFFRSAGFVRVNAVLYVQRQDRLAARTHVQALEVGKASPFAIGDHLSEVARYDWRRLVEWWSEAESIDHLDVRLFPDRPGMPDLVQDFCDVVGLPRPVVQDWPPPAELPSPEAVQFIERVLAACPDADEARTLGGRAVTALSRPDEQNPFCLTAKESACLMERFAESNAWVLDRVDAAGRVNDYFGVNPALPEERPMLADEQIWSFAAALGAAVR